MWLNGHTHTFTHKGTYTQTYTHTNRVSVLVLRFWLFWMFSWEIKLNKIRPEEIYLSVCERVLVEVCVKLLFFLYHFLFSPSFLAHTNTLMHFVTGYKSQLYGHVNIGFLKLCALVDHTGCASFLCQHTTYNTLSWVAYQYSIKTEAGSQEAMVNVKLISSRFMVLVGTFNY